MSQDEISSYPCDGTYPDPDEPRVTLRCSNRVNARRPSSTGKHFCPAKRCQASKQRFYRTRRIKEATLQSGELMLALVRAMMVPDGRVPCAHCGHPSALPGWAHPADAAATTPCYALGKLGPGLPPGVLGTAVAR